MSRTRCTSIVLLTKVFETSSGKESYYLSIWPADVSDTVHLQLKWRKIAAVPPPAQPSQYRRKSNRSIKYTNFFRLLRRQSSAESLLEHSHRVFPYLLGQSSLPIPLQGRVSWYLFARFIDQVHCSAGPGLTSQVVCVALTTFVGTDTLNHHQEPYHISDQGQPDAPKDARGRGRSQLRKDISAHQAGKCVHEGQVLVPRVLCQIVQSQTHAGGRVVDDCRRRPVRLVLEAEVFLENGLLLTPIEHAQDARPRRFPQEREQVCEKPDARVV